MPLIVYTNDYPADTCYFVTLLSNKALKRFSMDIHIDLKLIPMTELQFEDFRDRSCSMYAKVSPYFRDMPFTDAIKLI